MAIMIPDSCPSKASAGEKRLFRLFQNLLPDSFRVWYEPVVKGRYPDFIVLADFFGLVVLEQKGWSAKQVQKVTDTEVQHLVTEDGKSHVETDVNPLRKVRDYMYSLMDLLKRQPLLRHANGDHQGKLAFPCGYGVLFTSIKRVEAEEAGWAGLFPPDQVLFRDELDALEVGRNDREVIARLGKMFTVDFAFEPLAEDQLKTIQGVIHKEVVIKARPARDTSVPLGHVTPPGAQVFEVLDQEQEQMAKSIGDGHRVFAGVAGSGKTVLLVARAKLLSAQAPEKRILLLCYNRALGTYLRAAFAGDPAFRNIQVFTFHAWAKERTGISPYQQEPFESYERRLIAGLLHETAAAAETSRYDAILIDEAHDFAPDWFRCCVQALRTDPAGDLVIAVDGAQSLYGRTRSFTWKSVGVSALGRSKRLGVNYRNTQEILDLAWEVAQAIQPEGDESEAHVRVKPEKAVRSGPAPTYRACKTEGEEQAVIANLVRSFQEADIPDRDIAVLYAKQGGKRMDSLVGKLRLTVDVAWITDPDNRVARDRFMAMPGVRVSTIHSAKGLEFPAVILCAVDQLPGQAEEESSDANLLYVGLTRAMNRLALTWTGNSEFTRRIEQSGRAVALA